MRKWLTILTCLMLCFGINRSEAAISGSMVWEIRTAGNANNGCGFKSNASGTDYSQQDSAQISRTDLVIGNPDTNTLTSAATPFTTAEIGNLIQVTAGTGFTAGFYEITAVSGGNVATVDAAVGTAGSTGGTGAVGGACIHPNNISTKVIANNVIHIKSGTYVKVGANAYVLSLSVAGGNGTPITWLGYNSSRNDNPTGVNRPVFEGNANTTNIVVGTTSNIMKNFVFQNATADNITNTASNFILMNVRSTAAGDDGAAGSGNFIDCEIDTNTDEGLDTSDTDDHYMYFSYVHDNGGSGLLSTNAGTGASSLGSIYDTNVGNGFYSQRNILFLINNVAYNNSGAASDGFDIDGVSTAVVAIVLNNISKDNGQYAFQRDAATNQAVVFDYNLYNGHTTELNNITAGAHDAGDVDPLFNNAASGDFTFSSSSSPAIGAALVQTLNGATGDYSWNIGVDQGDHAAGGGASAHTFVGGF